MQVRKRSGVNPKSRMLDVEFRALEASEAAGTAVAAQRELSVEPLRNFRNSGAVDPSRLQAAKHKSGRRPAIDLMLQVAT